MSHPRSHAGTPRAVAAARAVVLAGVLLPGLFALSGRAAAGVDCPAAVVHADQYETLDPFAIDAFVCDSTISFAPTASVRFQFDRTVGRTAFSASSSGRFRASLRIVERFEVLGVPPGTPVEGTMEFRLGGRSEQNCGGSGCGVRFEGTLAIGPDSVRADANQVGPGNGPLPLAATLSLPIRFVAGTPVEAQFILGYGTGPGGSASAEGVGTYVVTGLPAGARVIACPAADVTPARRPTWGRLKQSFR